MRRCRLCVMPETEGHIILDDDGVCDLCKIHIDSEKVNKIMNIELLKKKIEKHKSKESKYDCIVSVSGGKDSIMTLYIAKRILHLNPLAVFIDNGFSYDEMYSNIRNATDILNVDLKIFKTFEIKEMFKYLLVQKKPLYYCRICHAFIDIKLREICEMHRITLVLGGYTKGQNYLKNNELYWIYKLSDKNIKEILVGHKKFNYIAEVFPNISAYLHKNYKPIVQLSPFWYIEWNEDAIIDTITKELKFKLPSKSWPKRSTNCLFNYVSQYMAVHYFNYSQHESENSYLVRCGELTREKAIEIIETPIKNDDLENVLENLDLKLEQLL